MHDRIVDTRFRLAEAMKALRPLLRSLTLSLSRSHPADECLPMPPLLVPETGPALAYYAAQLRTDLADSPQGHMRWAQAAQSCRHLHEGGVAAVWHALNARQHLLAAAATHAQEGGEALARYEYQGLLVAAIAALDALGSYGDCSAFGDPIDICTRADLLASGLLIEADPKLCRESGYPPVSVAFTLAEWEDGVTWTERDTAASRQQQDETGRLRDVLLMGHAALGKAWRQAEQTRQTASEIFTMVRVPRTDRPRVATPVALRLHLAPGADGTPVVTIGHPDED